MRGSCTCLPSHVSPLLPFSGPMQRERELNWWCLDSPSSKLSTFLPTCRKSIVYEFGRLGLLAGLPSQPHSVPCHTLLGCLARTLWCSPTLCGVCDSAVLPSVSGWCLECFLDVPAAPPTHQYFATNPWCYYSCWDSGRWQKLTLL